MSSGPLDLGAIKGSVELDISNFERRYGDVDRQLTALAARQVKDVSVGADTDTAMRDLNAVDTMLRSDLDGARAEVVATADVGKADAALGAIDKALASLDGDMAVAKVDADTSPAEAALDRLGGEGAAAGDEAGQGMSKGILAGLAAIPVLGGVALIGVAIANGLLDGILAGLSQEASRDMFSARTGLDEATSEKFGRAAGDAYGSAWGNSVEENLDTARLALQGGLIDSDATTVEVEKVIASLSGVSDILGEDIPRLSRAVGVMMKTGMAKDAQEALDIIVAGTQAGANVSEDLLDTLTEYPAVFAKLGIDGEMSVGLISQAMQGGARDTDYAADALKEFQVRATDGSKLSGEAFALLGLDAQDMTAKIAKGGDDASTGLGMVLDGLRAMEDPVKRNEAAVGLFGTKAEDLGDALFAMDTSTAVTELEKLGEVAGRSDDALTKMADNGASSVESAKRSIEISADGLKGVLAQMFEDPLSDVAAYVSTNRAGVLEYFEAIGLAAFDMAESGIQGAAALVESFGSIPRAIEPVLVNMSATLAVIQAVSEAVPGIPDVNLTGSIETLQGMIGGLQGVEYGAKLTADAMRVDLLDKGLTPLRESFAEGMDTQIMSAQVHDAMTAMVSDISSVGESVEDLNNIKLFEDGSFKVANEDARALDEQLRIAVDSMGSVQAAASNAGESQASLNKKWKAGRDALVDQLQAMGFTKQEAGLLAEAYGAIPDQISTSADLVTAPALVRLNDLIVKVDSASGTITVNGDKANGDATLAKLIGNVNAADGTVTINGDRVPANLTLEQYLGKVNRSDATATILADDRPGRGALADLLRGINRAEGTAEILGDAAKGKGELFAFLGKVNKSEGTLDVDADDAKAQKEIDRFFARNTGRKISVAASVVASMFGGNNADGGFYDGGLKRLADGGLSDTGEVVPRQSMMGGPAYGKRNVLWGEEETGWEAYISGKPGMESRNRGVLEEAATRLGMAVAPIEAYANGAFSERMPATLNMGMDTAGLNDLVHDSVEKAVARSGTGQQLTGGVSQLLALAAPFGVPITSTYRPGATTLTGKRSKHSIGKAVDTGLSERFWNYLEARKDSFSELYSPWGLWNKGLPRSRFPGWQTVRDSHQDHIHMATFGDGGIMDALSNPKAADTGQVALDPKWNLVYNGLGRVENLAEGLAGQQQPTVAPAPVHVTVEGVVTGRFEVGPDGIFTLMDGRIHANDRERTLATRGGPR